MVDNETLRSLIATELGEGEVQYEELVCEQRKVGVIYWKLSDDELYNLSFNVNILDNLTKDTVFDEFVKYAAIKLKTYRAKKHSSM